MIKVVCLIHYPNATLVQTQRPVFLPKFTELHCIKKLIFLFQPTRLPVGTKTYHEHAVVHAWLSEWTDVQLHIFSVISRESIRRKKNQGCFKPE